MKKSELIIAMKQQNPNFSDDQLVAGVEAIFATIANALSSENRVDISGFRAFSVKEKSARTGRNPRTGETIKVAAMKVPKFRAAKALKDSVK